MNNLKSLELNYHIVDKHKVKIIICEQLINSA